MPIKFKCNCGHVLTVPDVFSGKTGKCPKCQKSLKVPAAAAAARKTTSAKTVAVQAAALKPTPAQPTPAPVGAMDALLDDVGLKLATGPICPTCGASIKKNAVVCTRCGLHFEKGEKLAGFDAVRLRPEFDNPFLQEASDNMIRDSQMDLRRDRAAMPWWVIMSFLIGAVTLCAAGVIIVDGNFGTPADASTFIGKIQRLPVFTVLGITACITGLAITVFAHLSICLFGFTKSMGQGLACFVFPLLYSIIYGIMNWTDNKAPVKAIMIALPFIALGLFLIYSSNGFESISAIL